MIRSIIQAHIALLVQGGTPEGRISTVRCLRRQRNRTDLTQSHSSSNAELGKLVLTVDQCSDRLLRISGASMPDITSSAAEQEHARVTFDSNKVCL